MTKEEIQKVRHPWRSCSSCGHSVFGTGEIDHSSGCIYKHTTVSLRGLFVDKGTRTND